MGSCENVEIQGGVTVFVPDGAQLMADGVDIDTQLECDILPVVMEVLESLVSENTTSIDGLEGVRVITPTTRLYCRNIHF